MFHGTDDGRGKGLRTPRGALWSCPVRPGPWISVRCSVTLTRLLALTSKVAADNGLQGRLKGSQSQGWPQGAQAPGGITGDLGLN